MSKKGDLYKRFFEAHVRADPLGNKEITQKKAIAEWNEAKQLYPKESDFFGHLQKLIDNLNLKATQWKVKNTLLKYFGSVSILT